MKAWSTKGETYGEWVRKDAARALRASNRKKIADLASLAKAARSHRETVIQAFRATVLADRVQIRKRVDALRKEERRLVHLRFTKTIARLREAADQERARLAQILQIEKDAARLFRSEEDRRRADLQAEKKYQRDVRNRERVYLREKREATKDHRRGRSGSREAAEESDDRVRQNLPPHLLPLFNRMPRQFKATAHKSRWEAVLDFAHDHPEEAMGALTSHADAKTDRMIAEFEAREEHEMRSASPGPAKARVRRHYTPEELANTPF